MGGRDPPATLAGLLQPLSRVGCPPHVSLPVSESHSDPRLARRHVGQLAHHVGQLEEVSLAPLLLLSAPRVPRNPCRRLDQMCRPGRKLDLRLAAVGGVAMREQPEDPRKLQPLPGQQLY